VFRSTVTIQVPVKVCVLGSGAPASKLAIDGNLIAVQYPGSESGGTRTIRSMWFGSINTNTTQALAAVTGTGARVLFEDCMFGNDPTTRGPHATLSHVPRDALVTFSRCSFFETAGSYILSVASTPGGRVTIRDCDFKSIFTGAQSAPHIYAGDGTLIEGCYFDASALTSGTFAYINYPSSTAFSGAKFLNNRFRKGTAVLAAFRGTSVGVGVWESGNSFGDVTFMPLYIDAADGYADVTYDQADLRTRGSRLSRSFGLTSNAAAIDIDAKNYALAVIKRTAAGGVAITATLGSLGDTLTIQIVNVSGVAVAPTFGSMFLLGGGAGNSIATGGSGQYKFDFLPVGVGTTGKWVMTTITFTI